MLNNPNRKILNRKSREGAEAKITNRQVVTVFVNHESRSTNHECQLSAACLLRMLLDLNPTTARLAQSRFTLPVPSSFYKLS